MNKLKALLARLDSAIARNIERFFRSLNRRPAGYKELAARHERFVVARIDPQFAVAKMDSRVL